MRKLIVVIMSLMMAVIVSATTVETGFIPVSGTATADLMRDIFSDEIEWEEIKKGDILIREYYEEDRNKDGKISEEEKHTGHGGIAIGQPVGDIRYKKIQFKILTDIM